MLRHSTARAVARILVAIALVSGACHAAETAKPKPYGSAFRALFGDRLERDYGIAVLGFAHVTAAVSNHHIEKTRLPQGRGRNVQPQGGVMQDEGINLQHVGLFVCKGAGCPPGRVFEPTRNMLSRITPLPGPRGDEVVVDWAVSVLYGEDAVFWTTKGFDDWNWNAKDRNRLALTQWFLDIYLPVGAGASLMLGSWQSPLSQEIGYAFDPPNLFASRTYAFMAGPAKHVGALLEVKLPTDPQWGHASLGIGVHSDWNAIDFGSGAGGPSFTFIGRWRSPDMRTWLDLELLYGNGEDDFGDVLVDNRVAYPRGGGTQYLALSSTDEYLDRFVGYLIATHEATEQLSLVFESVYGYQEGGDLQPLPFAITRDSAFYGMNLGFRYALTQRLKFGARLEWFADPNAASVLWSGVGATGGDVYAATLSAAWLVAPHLQVRPELKFDVYDGGGHLFATDTNGRARHDSQALFVLNFEFRF